MVRKNVESHRLPNTSGLFREAGILSSTFRVTLHLFRITSTVDRAMLVTSLKDPVVSLSMSFFRSYKGWE